MNLDLRKLLFLFCFATLLFWGCEKDAVHKVKENENRYIHLSHTKSAINNSLDEAVAAIPFEQFGTILLGGDLLKETSISETSMRKVNNAFYLNQDRTFLSIGNHDTNDLERLKSYTQKSEFAFQFNPDVSFLTINTEDCDGAICDENRALITGYLEQSLASNYVIILHHKLFWLHHSDSLYTAANSISNGPIGNCDYCLPDDSFYNWLYPKIVALQSNGTQVILLGGDLGLFTSTFEYKTAEGIYFLGSGMNVDFDERSVLLFEYLPSQETLNWEFTNVEAL